MKVTVIPVVVGSLRMVSKEEESRPSKLQLFWDKLEYLERSKRPEETCCHSDFSEKPTVKTGGKHPHWEKIGKNNSEKKPWE